MVGCMKKMYTKQCRNIEVHLIGDIAWILNKRVIRFRISKPIKVSELIDRLARYAARKGLDQHVISKLFDSIHAHTLILINDIEISALNEMDTIIKPCDKIVLLNFSHLGLT